MSMAIHVKTESGDEYLYPIDKILNDDDVLKYLKEKLGEEYPYISTYTVAQTIQGTKNV